MFGYDKFQRICFKGLINIKLNFRDEKYIKWI